jgi:adenosylmethionine-8-amino-7-oxononanoate aminotransferase
VITGFGRTGRWFALGHWGVQPDLMSFAKGVTSGYLPLGGVVVSKRVHQAMEDAPMDERFMHAATYSGHPVCCAVGLRNIDIIEQEALPERAAAMGRRLLSGLETLRSLSAVGDVRGLGMMCGVELVEDQATRRPAIGLGGRVVAEAMKRGLIIRQRGGGGTPVSGDSLCIAPPLMTPEATLDRIVSIVGEAIQAAA